MLRFIRALRVLVFSIIHTMRSLVWSLVLLFVIMYSFGILLHGEIAVGRWISHQLLGEFLSTLPPNLKKMIEHDHVHHLCAEPPWTNNDTWEIAIMLPLCQWEFQRISPSTNVILRGNSCFSTCLDQLSVLSQALCRYACIPMAMYLDIMYLSINLFAINPCVNFYPRIRSTPCSSSRRRVSQCVANTNQLLMSGLRSGLRMPLRTIFW